MVEAFATRGLEATIIAEVDSFADELTELRRTFHAHPELSFQEKETTERLSKMLTGWDVSHRVLSCGVGLIAEITARSVGPWVALRADMDALGIDEKNDVPYRSTTPSVMHACGHDAHMTCAVGAIRALLGVRNQLPGNVRVLFQPGEEVVPGGALQLVADGGLENVEGVFALHVAPELPVGTIGIRRGSMTASADRFDVHIRGRSGHGARPHQAIDPIFIASQIIGALYHGMRRFDPREAAVLSVGSVHGGYSPNVIPEEAELAGTVRAIEPATRPLLHEMIRRIVKDVTNMHGGKSEVIISAGPPSIVNDDASNRLLSGAAAAVIGTKNISWIARPTMGSEDFAELLQRVPGCMFRLGVGSERYFHGLHSAQFDLEEEALPIGAKILAAAAVRQLQKSAGLRSDP